MLIHFQLSYGVSVHGCTDCPHENVFVPSCSIPGEKLEKGTRAHKTKPNIEILDKHKIATKS